MTTDRAEPKSAAGRIAEQVFEYFRKRPEPPRLDDLRIFVSECDDADSICIDFQNTGKHKLSNVAVHDVWASSFLYPGVAAMDWHLNPQGKERYAYVFQPLLVDAISVGETVTIRRRFFPGVTPISKTIYVDLLLGIGDSGASYMIEVSISPMLAKNARRALK